MTSPLNILIAKDEIVDTINRLFRGTDTRDWAMVRDALAPRVHLDMTSLTGGQPTDLSGADLAASWEAGLRPIQAVHHQAGNYRVTVAGESAEAFCYGTAAHFRPTQAGRNVRMFVGTYNSVWSSGRPLAHCRLSVQPEVPGWEPSAGGRGVEPEGEG